MCDFILRHEKYGQSSCPVIGQVPTALARSRTAEGQLEQPWPVAPLWGQRQAEAVWGHQPAVGVRVRHGEGNWAHTRPRVTEKGHGVWLGTAWGVCARAGLQAAGDCLCCGIAGAGADSPLGLSWGPGPWGGWGQPQEMLGRKSYCCPHSLDSHITPGQFDFPYIWSLMCYKGWKLLTTDLDFCLTCEHTCAGRADYRVSLSHNHPFLVFQAHMEII